MYLGSEWKMHSMLEEISNVHLYETYKNILKNRQIEEEEDFEGQLEYTIQSSSIRKTEKIPQ